MAPSMMPAPAFAGRPSKPWDGSGPRRKRLYRRWPGKAELVVDAMARLFDTLCPVDAGSVRADAEATLAHEQATESAAGS